MYALLNQAGKFTIFVISAGPFDQILKEKNSDYYIQIISFMNFVIFCLVAISKVYICGNLILVHSDAVFIV